MKGESLLLLGAGILFGTTGAYAQHPEGGHSEGQDAEAPRSEGRNDVPRANQGHVPPAPVHSGITSTIRSSVDILNISERRTAITLRNLTATITASGFPEVFISRWRIGAGTAVRTL